jgi:hypothetical protein
MIILSIQLTLAYLWILSAWPKLTSDEYIQSFEKQFANTFFAALPGGMTPQVYFLGLIELAAGILALISIVSCEWNLKSFRWLSLCLALSALTFVFLGFGLRILNNFDGSANIFFYLTGIVVFSFYVGRIESTAK